MKKAIIYIIIFLIAGIASGAVYSKSSLQAMASLISCSQKYDPDIKSKEGLKEDEILNLIKSCVYEKQDLIDKILFPVDSITIDFNS